MRVRDFGFPVKLQDQYVCCVRQINRVVEYATEWKAVSQSFSFVCT